MSISSLLFLTLAYHTCGIQYWLVCCCAWCSPVVARGSALRDDHIHVSLAEEV